MTVETLKKKWLWHYIKPKYFYIPVKDINNQGTVKFSFYKPTYYESDVFNYVESVSVIIFKNDINKTYVTQSSTTNGMINLGLSIGNYFMYITSIKGCVLTETKYEFEIFKNQETVVDINFDLAFYRATVQEENDESYNFSMSEENPYWYNLKRDNGDLLQQIKYTQLEGNKTFSTVFYDEKNNYKGKTILGAEVGALTSFPSWWSKEVDNQMRDFLWRPFKFPLNSLYEFDSYNLEMKLLDTIKHQNTFIIDFENPFDIISKWGLNLKGRLHSKATRTYYENDGSILRTETVDKEIEEVTMNILTAHYPNYEYAEKFSLYAYYNDTGWNTVIPQNIKLLPNIPATVVPPTDVYIYKDNLTPDDMIMMSYPQSNNMFMSEDNILINKKLVNGNLVYISQGNRTFECSFHDKIANIVEQGKWLD